MAKIDATKLLRPSLLDRLLDDDPGVSREAPMSRTQMLRNLIQAVRRDLEDLLNTRQVIAELPAQFDELTPSMVSYGIPDVTTSKLSSSTARDEFLRNVERTIRQFEPRLRNPRVSLAGESESLDRTLRFRVDAMLRVEPAPEKVVFDSELEPSTGLIAVKSQD